MSLADQPACPACGQRLPDLHHDRMRRVEELLAEEGRELTAIEQEVVR